ncbi:MAG: transcriptional regulator with XRE-family HTH domain [Granulosicoccus sp.]
MAALIADKPDPKVHGLTATLLASREASGCDTTELVNRCFVARTQIAFYEAGLQKNPGLRTVAMLARGYELPLWRVVLATLSEIRIPPISAPSAKPVRKRKRLAKAV